MTIQQLIQTTQSVQKEVERICYSWDDQYNLGKQEIIELIDRISASVREETLKEAMDVVKKIPAFYITRADKNGVDDVECITKRSVLSALQKLSALDV